jgi:hypothetical protein
MVNPDRVNLGDANQRDLTPQAMKGSQNDQTGHRCNSLHGTLAAATAPLAPAAPSELVHLRRRHWAVGASCRRGCYGLRAAPPDWSPFPWYY